MMIHHVVPVSYTHLDVYKRQVIDNDDLHANIAGEVLLVDYHPTICLLYTSGPKWCGKTTTAQQQAKSALYMDDPKTRGANLLLAETDPEILFKGETPRLIDEWKLAPKLWDAARFEISRRRVPGQFIFTGSSVPPDMSEITHSGTGRFAWVTMRTMSLWESGDSNGNISLNDLFQGDTIPALSKDISLNELAYLTCRGGWPGSLVLNRQAALRQATNYVDAVVRSDISRVDNCLLYTSSLLIIGILMLSLIKLKRFGWQKCRIKGVIAYSKVNILIGSWGKYFVSA